MCGEFYQANATLHKYSETTARKTFLRVIEKHENLWGFIILDKDSQTPVGYSLITSYWCNEEGGDVLIIDEIFIKPYNRHKGYGRLFMEWLEKHFQDEAVSVTLEVLTTNDNAKALYEKEGFSPDGFVTYTKYLTN
jgi:ribosomal protein S18 acetylase RimI-like enzyme